MNKGCRRVKHGNKVRPAKKQENYGHPGSDAANDSPCGAHDPMRGKTWRRRVELIRSTKQMVSSIYCAYHTPVLVFESYFIGFLRSNSLRLTTKCPPYAVKTVTYFCARSSTRPASPPFLELTQCLVFWIHLHIVDSITVNVHLDKQSRSSM